MEQIQVTEAMVNLSLEIISLLSGETFSAVRSGQHVTIVAPQHRFALPERIGKQQILQLIKKLVEQLMRKSESPSHCIRAVKEECEEDGDPKGSRDSEGQEEAMTGDELPLTRNQSVQSECVFPTDDSNETTAIEGSHYQSEDQIDIKVEDENEEGSAADLQLVMIYKEEEETSVMDEQHSADDVGLMGSDKQEESSADDHTEQEHDMGRSLEEHPRPSPSAPMEANFHLQSQVDPKPFKCSECGLGFATTRYLSRHEQIHINYKRFACPECGKCFSSKPGLGRHLLRHQGQRFECTECGKSFTEKSWLKDHYRTHTGERPFSCPECGKSFSSKQVLRRHMLRHTAKRYECSECGKCFTERSQLKNHLLIHTGENPFSCSECGKCFSQKSMLTSHFRIHTGDLPTCPECGKSFSRKWQLSNHMNIHRGEKPFSCAECGKFFTRKTELHMHQKIHTGERPFKCLECGKSFQRRALLTYHQRIHTGEHPHTCPDCGKIFRYRGTMLKHPCSHGPSQGNEESLCISSDGIAAHADLLDTKDFQGLLKPTL